MTSEVDELFDIKNAFYIGNFQTCINEAQRLKPSNNEVTIERDVYMYRAYLAQQKYLIVKDEIGANSPQLIQPLKMLANFLQNFNDRERIAAELEEQLLSGSGSIDTNNTTLIIVAASIFMHQGKHEEALRVLHAAPSGHLECASLRLQVYLRLDRTDLAKQEIKAMQESDDDATQTQLAQAWLNLALGGEKIKDAFYIYQELIDKHGPTALLLNGQGSCFIGQGKLAEAEGAFTEALDKDPRDADTLVNLVGFCSHASKPQEVTNRYLNQLKEDHPHHPFVRLYQKKSEDFDRMMQQYGTRN